jgi:hypothetical protein
MSHDKVSPPDKAGQVNKGKDEPGRLECQMLRGTVHKRNRNESHSGGPGSYFQAV